MARSSFEMPFGKYRGKPLSSLPDSYLNWLGESVRLREPLLTHLLEELRERQREEREGPAQLTLLPPNVDTAIAVEVIEHGRRSMARAYHPDRGGDTELMQAINVTADQLIDVMRRTG